MTNTITKITYNGDDYKVGAEYTAGTGISITSNEISNTGVTSFNGSTGTVTYTAPVTSVNGSTGAVTVQETLVSGTNIKTVNSTSLLGSGNITLNDVKVSATAPSSPTEGMLWYDTTNDKLKVYDGTNWNETGKEYNAGKGIEIGTIRDCSAMQGPAPSGFHVPLDTERQAVHNIWTALGGLGYDGTNFGIALKLPFAGSRSYSDASVSGQDVDGNYWSSLRYSTNNACCLYLSSSSIVPRNDSRRSYGYSVRCFKDMPTIPTSSWTKLYGTSIESGGIFWNSTDGLISLSSDGTNWITIADKNLGATTVRNSGDTLSESNCGGYFQWGNNYMFPFTGSVTTSSTQVDASNYGPGNYYSSSTFITRSSSPYRWDTTDNRNLRGGITGAVILDNAISNTGVLSVNGSTGAVTVSAVPTVGTNGQVLTVVSGAAAWANATGNVVVSSQANNILQSGMKIWAGEETDYANLGSYDSQTLYLTIPDQS